MKKILFALSMFLLSVPAMAQKTFEKYTVGYESGNKGIQVDGDDGVIVVVSKKDDRKITKHQEFYVSIINQSQNRFNFDPSKIQVEAINKNKTESCEVYTCDEWVKKEKTRILLWGPNNVEEQSVSTNVKGADGKTTTIETKAQIVTNANDEARAQAEASINSRYFKRVTITAGQMRYGMVVAKNPKAQNLILKIPVNGNIYIFDLSKE